MYIKALKSFFLLDKGNRNHEIEGLRALAILLVFCATYFEEYATSSYFMVLDSFGFFFFKGLDSAHIGVDLFFMISGFLISSSLLRNLRSEGFLQKRFRRLMPAHIFILIFVYMLQNHISIPAIVGVISVMILFYSFIAIPFVVYSILPAMYAVLFTICKIGVVSVEEMPFIANLFSISFDPTNLVNYVSWPLYYIYIFYFSFFVCVKVYLKVRKSLGLALGGSLALLLLFSTDDFRLLGLLTGIGLYFLVELKIAEKFLNNIVVRNVGLIGFISLPFFWTTFADAGLASIFYLLTSVFGFGVLHGVLHKHWYSSLFSNIFLRIFGAVSYSFYLSHAVVVQYFTKGNLHAWSAIDMLTGFVGVSLVALAFAILIFYFFERPVLQESIELRNLKLKPMMI